MHQIIYILKKKPNSPPPQTSVGHNPKGPWVQKLSPRTLTSQAPHARRGVGAGRQRAVVGRGGAEQDVVGQGLVKYWTSRTAERRPPPIAAYALIREGAVEWAPRRQVPIERKLGGGEGRHERVESMEFIWLNPAVQVPPW